jgi:hypothetical protein
VAVSEVRGLCVADVRRDACMLATTPSLRCEVRKNTGGFLRGMPSTALCLWALGASAGC